MKNKNITEKSVDQVEKAYYTVCTGSKGPLQFRIVGSGGVGGT